MAESLVSEPLSLSVVKKLKRQIARYWSNPSRNG